VILNIDFFLGLDGAGADDARRIKELSKGIGAAIPATLITRALLTELWTSFAG
jgi:hypothetical protein